MTTERRNIRVSRLPKGAEPIIREHQNTILPNDIFDRFIHACEKAEAPNEKLRLVRNLLKKRLFS